jgi:hypothetical protein
MAIEFTTRVADLKNATKQLLVNRGDYRETDVADLFVSECVATLRTVGTSTEIPVNGTSLGTARIPLPALQVIAKISGTFKSKDIAVQVEDGSIKVGTFRHRNPGIILGILPNQRIDLPVDTSLLDTLGVGALLTQHEIEEQGLTARMLEAWERANRAITSAASSLAAVGVSEQKIREMVEQQVNEAGERLRETFKR